MTVIITIDPNVRVEKNRTYVGFEDVRGGFAHAQDFVTVRVEETDLEGTGQVVSVDWESRLIYLDVEWSSIHPVGEAAVDQPVD